MNNDDGIELGWLLNTISRRKWLILGIALFIGFISFAISSLLSPDYEASTTIFFRSSNYSTSSLFSDLLGGDKQIQTYSQMVKDPSVLSAVIDKLKLQTTQGDLANRISIELPPGTQLIRLSVRASTASQAAQITNTLAEVFTQRVKELYTSRYTQTIADSQARIDAFQSNLDTTQAKIDTLQTQKTEKELLKNKTQNELNILTENMKPLQSTYQDLEISTAAIVGKVNIVEPVHVLKDTASQNYLATAVVSLGDVQTIGGSSVANDRLALTYAQLLLQPALMDGIIQDLSLSSTSSDLIAKIKVELVPGTQLIRLTYTDADEKNAGLVGEALVNAYIAQMKTLLLAPYAEKSASLLQQIDALNQSISQTQTNLSAQTAQIAPIDAELTVLANNLSDLRSDSRTMQKDVEQAKAVLTDSSQSILVTEPAQAPKLPIQHKSLYVLIGLILGLFVGVGVAFFLENKGDHIRSYEDIQRTLNLPILGTIGLLDEKTSEMAMKALPSSKVSEDFRALAARISLISKKHAVKTFLVTSPGSNDGKSVIVSNLAIALAKSGLKVILVDTDLRFPRLHKLFGLNQEGEASQTLLLNPQTIQLQQDRDEGTLQILTRGEANEDPIKALSSPNMTELMETLKGQADIVLFDSPASLPTADAMILTSLVDGVIIVLRADHTSNGDALKTVHALEQVGDNLLGVILNGFPAQN